MALFDRISQRNLFGLLRVGFGARLRSEVADIFLTAGVDGVLKRTDSRAEAPVFFFQSGDTTIKPCAVAETLPQSALCAILAAGPSSAAKSDPLFLNLSDQPLLSLSPAVVKISLQSSPNPHRLLFSFTSVGPHPKHISLRGVASGAAARSTGDLCKFATFHLEILASTIGKGFIPDVHYASQLSYITPVQAITHALLQLNVRFRLISVHKSVLASSSDSTGASQSLSFVHQDLSSTSESLPVVFSAFLLARPVDDNLPSSRFYSLITTDSSPTTSLYIPDPHSSARDPTLRQIPAEECPVCMNVLSGSWGAVNLGTRDCEFLHDSEQNGKCGSSTKETEKISRCTWLMAGPRGKAEIRHHRGNWETFFVEYVEQSLIAAWNDLPTSQFYTIADSRTRANVRATIERNLVSTPTGNSVKSAATTKPANRISQNSRGSSFNHAAALAGLSERNDSAPEANKSGTQTQSIVAVPRTKKKGKKAKSSSNGAASVVKADSPRSSLPRNAASKKAAKKNRKKNREISKSPVAGSTTTNASASASDKSNPSAPSDVSHSTGQSSQDSQNLSNTEPSNQADTRPSSTESVSDLGPPCAACGRATGGPLTRAMGKVFHPQCFCCGRCRRPIGAGTGQFRERGGIPYCEVCYANHLASRCARCAEPILDTVTTAMDKTWHKNCLTCSLCRLPLTQTFWLYADRPNEPRCSRCVTGEEQKSIGHSNRRMVNLPGFGRSGSNHPPFSSVGVNEAPPTLGNVSPDRSRARLHSPMLTTFPH